jgi:hypothetical protein
MSLLTVDQFISDLSKYHILTPKQQQNIQEIISISDTFFSRAQISKNQIYKCEETTIVLESGHQPNFLPHSGFWKKIFWLSWCQKQLEKKGIHAIAFFGFADQNLSTAKILSKNHIPYWNKKGSENVGFHIEEKDQYKPFWAIGKPTSDRWEKEINKISGLYKENLNIPFSERNQKNHALDGIIEILNDSYNSSKNFSELNSLIIAKISRNIFKIDNILFYTFSDLMRKKIFINESKDLILRQPSYNQIFNQTITNKDLNLRYVSPDRVPFWFHCECGGKFELTVSSPGVWMGRCPLCKKDYTFNVGENLERLEVFYPNMDFSAVARNIIFSNGLGTTLFLSGSGGALSYGVVSDEISKELKFYQSLSLSWSSRDYYFGRFHTRAIQELMNTYHLTFSDIHDGSFREKILSRISAIELQITNAKEKHDDVKNIKCLENMRNSVINVRGSVANIFQVIPSIIDLLICIDSRIIITEWGKALEDSTVEFDGVAYKIHKDIIYNSEFLNEIKYEDIPHFYNLISTIEVNS